MIGLLPARARPVTPFGSLASTDIGLTENWVVPSAPPCEAPPSAGKSQISKPVCTEVSHQDGDTHSPRSVPSFCAGHVALSVAASPGRAAVLYVSASSRNCLVSNWKLVVGICLT